MLPIRSPAWSLSHYKQTKKHENTKTQLDILPNENGPKCRIPTLSYFCLFFLALSLGLSLFHFYLSLLSGSSFSVFLPLLFVSSFSLFHSVSLFLSLFFLGLSLSYLSLLSRSFTRSLSLSLPSCLNAFSSNRLLTMTISLPNPP